jgi:glycerol uptake facilitator-like aquaporin
MFLLVNIADMATTLMAAMKHSRINEANYVYLLTHSFFLLVIFKFALVFVIVCFFVYTINKSDVAAYSIFMLIVILTIVTLNVTVNNWQVVEASKNAPEVINEIPTEQLIEMQKQQIVNPQLHLYLFCVISYFLFSKIGRDKQKQEN